MWQFEADGQQIIHAPALFGAVGAVGNNFELGCELVQNLSACAAWRFGNVRIGDENEVLESALTTYDGIRNCAAFCATTMPMLKMLSKVAATACRWARNKTANAH